MPKVWFKLHYTTQYIQGSSSSYVARTGALTMSRFCEYETAWLKMVTILSYRYIDMIYHIEGNFRGRKLSRIGEKYDLSFAEKTFAY